MSKSDLNLKKIQRRLFLLGLFRIPMIGYVRPRLIRIDEQHVGLRIKLRRRTKNHLNSMYFGALAVGADIAAGIHAFYFTEQSGRKISISFKAFEGEFLKRAETDVIFESHEGGLVKSAIQKTIETGERIHQAISIRTVDLNGDEVARFSLTVSVKVKG